MVKNEKTLKTVTSKTTKRLRKKSSKKNVKSVAGSALTQAPNRRRNHCEKGYPGPRIDDKKDDDNDGTKYPGPRTKT